MEFFRGQWLDLGRERVGVVGGLLITRDGCACRARSVDWFLMGSRYGGFWFGFEILRVVASGFSDTGILEFSLVILFPLAFGCRFRAF
jgi:hypothetical protein